MNACMIRALLALLPGIASLTVSAAAGTLSVPARTRIPTEHGMEIRIAPQQWDTTQTALIVCDFWDSHHCGNAVKRVNEMAPRMAAVVEAARQQGVLIIHAPSDCMEHYKDHPARQRAMQAPVAASHPPKITQWLHWKNADEEKAGYPIDASDGGCDDTPEEAAAWKAELARQGRTSGSWPWRAEHPAVRIDGERDVISDKGDEIWNMMEARGIRNVLFAGVHTNMCVCGRPFGLRQMANNGKNIVLLRDLTDTMYNPARPPFVSHYRGTELMLAHIEQRICPTALSSEVLGGDAFTFPRDARPHLAVMIDEDEYRTAETLPAFLETAAGGDIRISYILAPAGKPGEFVNVSALSSAQAVLVSVRRRPLAAAHMEILRAFIARGGAVVGIRTASHAFALRKDQPLPEGKAVWPEWDATILGGNYNNHLGNELRTFTRPAPGVDHPLLRGLPPGEFPTTGSLYRNSPLRGGAPVLLTGRAEGAPNVEPVAWVHTTPEKGRVFYTSLGAAGDFALPEFRQLLLNAIHWSLDRDIPEHGVR